MSNSILQIASNFIQNIYEKVCSPAICNIDDLTTELLQMSKEFSRDMTEAVLQQLNEQIREDKEHRREQGLTLHRREQSRSYLTELGAVNYRRDYYRRSGTGEYVHVLDQIIGVAPYERVGKNVSAQLVTAATQCSYARAGQAVTGGEVSRQTVRNKILKLGALEYRPEQSEKRIVRELHIYADEDHDHLQKPGKEKGKRIQINPLVVVTEGTRQNGGRNETIHPMRFVDPDFDTKQLSKRVEGYLYETYDMEAVKTVYIHGDGGNWIRGLLPDVRQRVEVLDGYHLGKQLKKLAAEYPKENVRYRLLCAINADDRGEADRILQGLMRKAAGDRKKEKVVRETANYILGHWDAVIRRKTAVIPGSCTEAQVSHVLAERFSRDPLGWSKEGLGTLSSQRVFVLNGGRIEGEDFGPAKKKNEQSYAEWMDRYIDDLTNREYDWSVLEGSVVNYFDQASGTQQAIRNLGRAKDWLFS